MLYYDRINLSEGTYVAKSNNSKKCLVCHYWFLIMCLNLKIMSVMVLMI